MIMLYGSFSRIVQKSWTSPPMNISSHHPSPSFPPTLYAVDWYVVLPGFLVQFGISYSVDKELKKFARQTIPDDPHRPDLRQVNNISVCDVFFRKIDPFHWFQCILMRLATYFHHLFV